MLLVESWAIWHSVWSRAWQYGRVFPCPLGTGLQYCLPEGHLRERERERERERGGGGEREGEGGGRERGGRERGSERVCVCVCARVHACVCACVCVCQTHWDCRTGEDR